MKPMLVPIGPGDGVGRHIGESPDHRQAKELVGNVPGRDDLRWTGFLVTESSRTGAGVGVAFSRGLAMPGVVTASSSAGAWGAVGRSSASVAGAGAG